MGTQTLFALGELTIAVSHTLAKLNNKTDKVLPYLQIPVWLSCLWLFAFTKEFNL